MKHTFNQCLFLVGVLLLAVGCATMESRWRDAATANTIAAYKEFLKHYPQGKYSEFAKKRIELIPQIEDMRRGFERFFIRKKDFPNPIQPVDADGDGDIDIVDVVIVSKKVNDYIDKKLQPFFDKVGAKRNEKGIFIDEEGNKITTDSLKMRLKDRLTIAEQNELDEVINELKKLGTQWKATFAAVFGSSTLSLGQ